MEDQLYYSPDLSQGSTSLDAEESKHLIKVLRKTVGDTVLFTDGKGWFYRGIINLANPKGCQVDFSDKYPGDDLRPFRLLMFVAPTKNINRFEWFVEKAVEIGVDEIIPLLCSRSERRNVNTDRLYRVAIAAMKQSRKSLLPRIHETTEFAEALDYARGSSAYIAWLDDTVNTDLADALASGTDVSVFIGPEGDFSREEATAAIASGCEAVHLGPYRLRTETAAIAACHTIQLLNRLKK